MGFLSETHGPWLLGLEAARPASRPCAPLLGLLSGRVTLSSPPRWTQELRFLFGAPATSLFSARFSASGVCFSPPPPCPRVSQFLFAELRCLPGNPLALYRDWGCYFLRPSLWAALVRSSPATFAGTLAKSRLEMGAGTPGPAFSVGAGQQPAERSRTFVEGIANTALRVPMGRGLGADLCLY